MKAKVLILTLQYFDVVHLRSCDQHQHEEPFFIWNPLILFK